MVVRVGVTAGIACGKSSVMQALQALQIPTLDTDAVVHDLYHTDTELQKYVQDTFGPDVLDQNGHIDRQKLGALVFADPSRQKLKLLESWTHPKVKTAIDSFFIQHQNKPLAVVEVPLLFESKMEALFTEIWVIKASLEQQLQRLIARNHLSKEQAQKRITAQMPLTEKLAKATVIIDNSGSLEQTQAQVQTQVERILKAMPSM